MLLREDGSVRYFSVRESARIQTFPDEYVFRGSRSEAMRQVETRFLSSRANCSLDNCIGFLRPLISGNGLRHDMSCDAHNC